MWWLSPAVARVAGWWPPADWGSKRVQESCFPGREPAGSMRLPGLARIWCEWSSRILQKTLGRIFLGKPPERFLEGSSTWCNAAETWQRSFHVYQVECQSELKIELCKLR